MLAELEVETNKELLPVKLLRSLPEKFENLRSVISLRDEFSSLEMLSTKIAEKYGALNITLRIPKTLKCTNVREAVIKAPKKNSLEDWHGQAEK